MIIFLKRIQFSEKTSMLTCFIAMHFDLVMLKDYIPSVSAEYSLSCCFFADYCLFLCCDSFYCTPG